MARIPLIGGAYSARSPIAACQKCINLFPEKNPKDSPVPLTHYQRPGLRALSSPTTPGLGRGVYRASNGNGYCVSGAGVYALQAGTWGQTLLGSIAPGSNPVSMIDNGQTLWLVDGTANAYTIDLGTNTFAPFVDPTGTFTGADKVDYIDTFMLWNVSGTKQFGSTLSNSLTIDPTYIASKTDYPDPLMTLIVNRHEILLVGQLKSEIWFDAGNPLFPFAELPGAYVEHGTCAVYSVASSDISVFWLSQDLQGSGMVLRQRGYETRRVSNHALEYQIRKMRSTVGINDAIGYTYQQDGHVFYILTFPAGNQTWVFDDAIGDPDAGWHQRAWTDGDGQLQRDRGMSAAWVYDQNVVMDWQNGTIYALDLDVYTDEVNGTKGPCSYIRTFPHIMYGSGPNGPLEANGHRIQFWNFQADIECGSVPLDSAGQPAQLGLRVSVDRGRSFNQTVLQTMGSPGQYVTSPKWPGAVGIARDMVIELSYSVNGPAALNGAWIDGEVEPT